MSNVFKFILMALAAVLSLVSCNSQKDHYEVGDYYNYNGDKGVVVEVDATHRHGKIMSLESLKTSGDEAENGASELGAGWYLPSIEELSDMYGNLGVVNSTLEEKGEHITLEFIWSSTIENGKMLSLKTSDGSIERNLPSSFNSGRARYFKKF